MIQYFFLAALAFILAGFNPANAENTMPLHLQAAEEIVREIAPADNEYAYKNDFITWKNANGADHYINRTDCSSFFNLLIGHVYGMTPEKLKALTGHKNPTARRWYDAIAENRTAGLLKVITSFGTTQPGDIIFVKYPSGTKDTGHVMIIAGRPQSRIASEPFIAGTQQWEIPVIDSSKSGHGRTDTRYISPKNFYSGVGKGIIRIYTTATGDIAGYSWSIYKNSVFQPVSEHAVIIARLEIGAKQ